MATLQQIAALTAYQLRASTETGRRKVTEQMVRDLAEPHAVKYISEHLDEHEDIPSTIKIYVDEVVASFRMSRGILTQTEYDAHIQARKDASTLWELTKDIGLQSMLDTTRIYLFADTNSRTYAFIRHSPALDLRQVPEEEIQKLAHALLQKQEVRTDMKEYKEQYIRSYQEWIAEQEPQQADKQKGTTTKKRWKLF